MGSTNQELQEKAAWIKDAFQPALPPDSLSVWSLDVCVVRGESTRATLRVKVREAVPAEGVATDGAG